MNVCGTDGVDVVLVTPGVLSVCVVGVDGVGVVLVTPGVLSVGLVATVLVKVLRVNFLMESLLVRPLHITSG